MVAQPHSPFQARLSVEFTLGSAKDWDRPAICLTLLQTLLSVEFTPITCVFIPRAFMSREWSISFTGMGALVLSPQRQKLSLHVGNNHLKHVSCSQEIFPQPVTFRSKEKDDTLDYPPTAHMDSFAKPRKVRPVASKMRKIQLVPQKPTKKIWYLEDFFLTRLSFILLMEHLLFHLGK